MPVIYSKYKPPKRIFRNGDISTIYSSVFRKVPGVEPISERLELDDGDFIDLEWNFCGHPTENCIIVVHGLEGNANRHYILGTKKIFLENGFDTCAINLRNCSKEMNQNFTSYHFGRTEDLDAVVKHVLATRRYKNIILKGFSLGGNLALKYVGEERKVPKEVKACIAISAPIDLIGTSENFKKTRNFLYSQNFLIDLKRKLKTKARHFPGKIDEKTISRIKSLEEFDNVYTSKFHGFEDAQDYYVKSSSKQFLKNIRIPALIINAQNDSFLSESCFPIQEAEANQNLTLEISKFGGHVGFVDKDNVFYTEKRALEFVKNVLQNP